MTLTQSARKLRRLALFFQVKQFGCRSFSLLFDDIETEMCAADKKAFSSFADAQVSITNQVYEHLRSPETFLFCPTGLSSGRTPHQHVSSAV